MDRKLLDLLVVILVTASCVRPARAETGTTNIVDGIYTNAVGPYTVGDDGPFNSLILSNGGLLENTTGILGNTAQATDNSALVTGVYSLWDNKASLYVGYAGSANQLVITNAGEVRSAGQSILGYTAGSSNNTARIGGAGSLWNCAELRVGWEGSGNQCLLSDGAIISSGGWGAVGYVTPSHGNAMCVSGQGTFWFGEHIAVGSYGATDNQLTLAGGAQVYGVYGYIGNGSNNRALVDGTGSLWYSDVILFVGYHGSGNQLTITNGGRVICKGADISGDGNRVLVIGTNSLWETGNDLGQLVVGGFGSSNHLAITRSARVNSWDGIVSGDSNLVQVLGPGSLWNNVDMLVVGEEYGLANQLVISDRGRVATTSTSLTGDDGRLLVSGAGSVLDNTGSLEIGGDNGARNLLTISNAGQVNDAAGFVGGLASPFRSDRNNDNAVVVTGPGSLWNSSGDLHIGPTGIGTHLTVSDGGRVNNNFAFVGSSGFGLDSVILVGGADSQWNSRGDLFLGHTGSGQRLTVADGGLVTCASGQVGFSFSRGNTAVITGPGALWNLANSLTLGSNGSDNRVMVTNGGGLISGIGSVGGSGSGRSNVVIVTGAGSFWTNRGGIFVGAASSVNHLRIEDAAIVHAAGLAVGNELESLANLASVTNGHLVVTNAAGSAVLQIQRATFTLHGGSVTADRLILSAAPLSLFNFNAGALNLRGSSVSNAVPFNVGDGLLAARLSLCGGVHAFASGLHIATASSLTATGTIRGAVFNSGQLALGPSAGSLTVQGDLLLADTATSTFQLGGPTPAAQHDFIQVTHFVRFAGALRVALVNNFRPASNAVFALMQFGSSDGGFSNVPSGTRLTLEGSAVTCRVNYDGLALYLSDFQNAQPATNEIDPAWAMQYFGHSPLTAQERLGDADGDGMSNDAEYLAGTSPVDPLSVLKITSVGGTLSGQVVLQFRFVPDKSYTIAYSSDLTAWTAVDHPSVANPAPGIYQWTDDGTQTGSLPSSAPNARRFYRINLR